MAKRLRYLLEDIRDHCITEAYLPKEGAVRVSPRFRERTAMIIRGNVLDVDMANELVKKIDISGAKNVGEAKEMIADQLLSLLGKRKLLGLGSRPNTVRFLTMFGPLVHAYAERDKHSAKSFRDDPGVQADVFELAADDAIAFANEDEATFEDLLDKLKGAVRDAREDIRDSAETAKVKLGRKPSLLKDVLVRAYDIMVRRIRPGTWVTILGRLEKSGVDTSAPADEDDHE